MLILTKIKHFSASHKLYNPEWSPEKNLEVFGKCANENWHGHNYELHVCVKGDPDPNTGFIINAQDLAKIMDEVIIKRVDHKNINLDVDFMKGKLSSTENFARAIAEQIQPVLSERGVVLHAIKLKETHSILVEYYPNN